jgi:hypothetical protein
MKRKITFLLCAVFFTANLLMAQTPVPNGNFETWTDTVTAGSWTTNNYSIGGFLNYNFVHRSTDAHGGTYAAQIETINIPILGDMGGLVTLGAYDMLSGLSGGTPITGKPTKLSGYFKYTPVNGDTMAVIVIMTKWNGSSRDTLFYNGVMAFSAVPAYNLFEIPITYDPPTASPDTVNIVAISSAGYAPQIGSMLYIDDLSFTYGGIGIEEVSNNPVISVFPNPSTGLVNVILSGKENTISVFNMLGEVVYHSQTSAQTNMIDLTGKPEGIYLIQIDNGSEKFLRKLIITK